MYRKFLRLTLLFTFITLGVVYYFYAKVTGSNVLATDEQTVFLEIPRGTSFDSLTQMLITKGLVEEPGLFRELAQRLNYQADPVRSGRFAIHPGMNLAELIRHLRKGKQAPVLVVLTTEREITDVAAKVARFIEPDSAALSALFHDQIYLDSIGYSRENLMSLFIPNSYEFFWNTTPRGFVNRMLREHQSFWAKEKRAKKAELLKLSPTEVYTLASIVEKETLQNDEKRRMAGVYYNRLSVDMKLQADPTAVFARRDFNTRRVTNYHLKFDSPYNTYRYKGLPPGPIAMASISSIDAVLNHEKHDYLYFCAKGDGSGYHTFAKTLAAHKRNAKIYRENRKRRGK